MKKSECHNNCICRRCGFLINWDDIDLVRRVLDFYELNKDLVD